MHRLAALFTSRRRAPSLSLRRARAPSRALARSLCLCTTAAIGLLAASADLASAAEWSDALRTQIERIDKDSPGTLGVYVKRLDGGQTFSYGADQRWYLGSTVKVPVAIAVFQQVDAGKLKLTDKVTLQDTDKIEAGQLVWSKSGSVFDVDTLLQRMLMESDNTGANMLIRTVGEDRLNELAKSTMGSRNVGRLTTLAAIRYDVYAEIHPDARKLPNERMVRIASAPLGPQRVEAVRNALNLKKTDLKAKTIDEAYDRYYEKQLNTATLEGYGDMLEKLVKGELLSPASTQRIFTDMKYDIFTNYRLQAGLPRNVHFIHKTGTQYRRACHVGVIHPQDGGKNGIVVATCAADLDEQNEAGKVFERVGRAITQTVLAPSATVGAVGTVGTR